MLLVVGGAWLAWLLRSLCRLCRVACRERGRGRDGRIPAWAVRQPDPLIYSQQYLMAKGLGVTWDNPDIHVERAGQPGVVVDSHTLAPATDYVVVAHVWNGSTQAPVADLPVAVSYLDFGAGTTRHEVGATTVNLPVKGAPGLPGVARVPWRTPPAPGHYCLQVELQWPDDAEPGNNLGQHNTDVRALNSPRATFTFALRNPGRRRATLVLRADGYAIPELPPCPPEGGHPRRHDADAWPVPDGWRVVVHPEEVGLDPGAQTEVTVDVTAPDGFVGRQAVNVNAFDGRTLVGGVTLYAEGSG
ncbi:MAG: hypothetical protein M3326_12825 [Actinomycetota bacterium]|nr:hypothetical protein [Actinomycetota bacterium]